MGIASELDYRPAPRNMLHKVVAWTFSTRLGAWAASRVIAPVDRMTRRLTSQRTTFTQWLSGVRPVWVTMVGARSGRERSTPLYGIPYNDDLAVIGTGVGRAETPAWVHNLIANPDCTVSLDRKQVDAHARLARTEESEDIWKLGADLYPGFPKYRERLERDVKLFVLEPRGS